MKRAREVNTITAILVCFVLIFLLPGNGFAEEIIPIFLQEVPAEGHALVAEEILADPVDAVIEAAEEEQKKTAQEDAAQAALRAAIEEELSLMEKANRMEASFRTANLSGVRAEIVAGKCG